MDSETTVFDCGIGIGTFSKMFDDILANFLNAKQKKIAVLSFISELFWSIDI